MPLTMELSRHEDMASLRLTGRIIGADSKKLEKKLEELYKKGVNRNVVDITELDFMDSYGLGMLVYHHSRFTKDGREFLLLNANQNQMSYINRLLDITRLNMVFRVVTQI